MSQYLFIISYLSRNTTSFHFSAWLIHANEGYAFCIFEGYAFCTKKTIDSSFKSFYKIRTQFFFVIFDFTKFLHLILCFGRSSAGRCSGTPPVAVPEATGAQPAARLRPQPQLQP
jgi:hypothetical protein